MWELFLIDVIINIWHADCASVAIATIVQTDCIDTYLCIIGPD